jgi:hypothetical protein
MSANNATINSLKGMSTLVRARFGPGMLLQHEDLEQLQTYTRELSRLMFRSLFGCGVVCGLVVEAKPDNCGKIVVTVGAGLALGCSGDPIYLPKDQSLLLDEQCAGDIPTPLWVILCATTKCCAPRPSMCASDEEESSSACTRERDGFEIRIVRELPKCICGCLEPYSDFQSECGCVDPHHPCYSSHYEGKCKCNAGEDCDCCCDCVLLAKLTRPEDQTWMVDHSVRLFKRPVLIADPQVALERARATAAQRHEAQQREQMGREQLLKQQLEKAQFERQRAEKEVMALRTAAQKASKPAVVKQGKTPKA